MSQAWLRQHMATERKIVRAFVDAALAAGYRLAVSLERGYDTDEMLLGSTNAAAIMAEAFAGDEAHIFVQPAHGVLIKDGAVVSEGWVYIVLGNYGYDVLADWTAGIEPLLAEAIRISEAAEAQEQY